ncbi:hypothetical protein NMY22_g10177 [Coprinellus aureogranulatus]|nr:hypothetical protein NMY22_g10177 [Coprinellus aureogranulatus]
MMLYTHQQIRPPHFVRNATPLMVQNRLTDWNALSLAVRSGRDSGDDLLARYDLAWWSSFQEGADIESFKQSPIDIVRFWSNQRKNLPAPIPMPPVGLVQLNALADDELERAWSIGCDGLKILDDEIADNERFIADVTVMLVRCSAAMRDLKAAEERAMDEAEEMKVRALAFDQRYVDLFCADLVRLVPARVPSSDWVSGLLSSDLEVSLTLTGIASSIADWERTYLNFRLVDLVERLHVHCLSDEDVWAAITSGCFSDGTNYFGAKEPFPPTEWWAPNKAIPTFASVLEEWEDACLRRLHSATFRGEISPSILPVYITQLEEEQRVVEEALDHVARSARRIGEIIRELNVVFYDSSDFL